MRIISQISDLWAEGLFSWKQQLTHGIFVVLFGVTIVLLPQLLVALAAALVVSVGAAMIGSALALRRAQRAYQHQTRSFW